MLSLVYSPEITVAVTCPWGSPTPEQWNIFWTQGDVNRDGVIDSIDLDLISAMLGWTGPPGSIPEDINSDGVVDVWDYQLCAKNNGIDICTYFEPPPPPPPEEIFMWILAPMAVGFVYTVVPYGLRA